jgi:hypothetical protein
MTAEIAKCLDGGLKPFGVGVVIEAAHECMTTRGVHKSGVTMVTSCMLEYLGPKPKLVRSFCQQSILRRAPRSGAVEHYVLVGLLNQRRIVAFLLFPLPCHLLKPNSVRQVGPRSISF